MGATGTGIRNMILAVIGLVIGLYLIPTIIGVVAPLLAASDTANNAGLVRSILQFVPVGFVVGMLALAFGMSISVAVGSGSMMGAKPALIIGAVITIVIGITLISIVSNGVGNSTIAAGSNGVCTGATSAPTDTCTAFTSAAASGTTAFVGGYQVGTVSSGDTAAAILARGTSLVSQLGLTRTILGFVTIGYVVSILGAAFALGNMGTGGALTRRFSGRY